MSLSTNVTTLYLIKGVSIESDKDWSKDLLCVALHGGLDFSEDGRGYKVTRFITRHYNVTTIKDKLKEGER